MPPELQTRVDSGGIADVVGDSLALSRAALISDVEFIVFCGVVFMAQTAKILNPHRTVLLPSHAAGCSLASSITGQDVRPLRERHPEAPVIAYINTYAGTKAECDICCTSRNALAVATSFAQGTGNVKMAPSATIRAISPNPVPATGTELSIACIIETAARIRLVSVAGEDVGTLWNGQLQVGKYNLPVSIPDTVANGAYLLVLESGAGQQMYQKSIIIAR